MFTKPSDRAELVRWGGLAGVVAGVMWVLSTIVSLLAPQGRALDSFSDYLFEIVLVVAFAGTLVAIAGLHALQSGRYGRLGAAASLLTFIGYALVLVVAHVTTLVGGEPIYAVRLAGGLAVLVGSAVLGAMILRARVLPWWCGVLLIVGFPLGDASNAVVRGGEGIVLGIVWVSISYALLSLRGTVAEQPSRVASTSESSGSRILGG